MSATSSAYVSAASSVDDHEDRASIAAPFPPIAASARTTLPGFEPNGGIDMPDKIALVQASANLRCDAGLFDAMDVEEESEPANVAAEYSDVPAGVLEDDVLPGGPPILVESET